MEILQVKSASQKEAFSKARKFIHRGNTKSTRAGLCQTIKVKEIKNYGIQREERKFLPQIREQIPLNCEFRILSNCCY